MWLNHARLDQWTEFGHSLLLNNRVNREVRLYGLFSGIMSRNLNSRLSDAPDQQGSFEALVRRPRHERVPDTPLLLLVPWIRERARSLLALSVTAAVIALPGLFYMNDGWYQFGFRFSNDYLPYLFLILAVGKLSDARVLHDGRARGDCGEQLGRDGVRAASMAFRNRSGTIAPLPG